MSPKNALAAASAFLNRDAVEDVNRVGALAVGSDARSRFLSEAIDNVLDEDRELLVELANR